MEENSKESDIEIKYLIGFIITALPFWGYLLAYQFESGYSQVFGIPQNYIVIKIEDILYFVGIIIIFLTVLLFTIYYFSFFLSLHFKYIKYIVIGTILIIFISVFYLKTNFNIKTGLELLLLISITSILSYPLVKGGNKNSLLSRNKDLSNFIFKYQAKKYGKTFIFVITLFFISIFSSNMIGTIIASSKKVFYCLNNDQKFVIVRIYNENIILLPTDEIKQYAYNHLTVINQNNLDTLSLTTIYPFEEIEKKEKENLKDNDSTKTK